MAFEIDVALVPPSGDRVGADEVRERLAQTHPELDLAVAIGREVDVAFADLTTRLSVPSRLARLSDATLGKGRRFKRETAITVSDLDDLASRLAATSRSVTQRRGDLLWLLEGFEATRFSLSQHEKAVHATIRTFAGLPEACASLLPVDTADAFRRYKADLDEVIVDFTSLSVTANERTTVLALFEEVVQRIVERIFVARADLRRCGTSYGDGTPAEIADIVDTVRGRITELVDELEAVRGSVVAMPGEEDEDFGIGNDGA